MDCIRKLSIFLVVLANSWKNIIEKSALFPGAEVVRNIRVMLGYRLDFDNKSHEYSTLNGINDTINGINDKNQTV